MNEKFLFYFLYMNIWNFIEFMQNYIVFHYYIYVHCTNKKNIRSKYYRYFEIVCNFLRVFHEHYVNYAMIRRKFLRSDMIHELHSVTKSPSPE